jgi:flagellar hook-associated protein 3 FlgL
MRITEGMLANKYLFAEKKITEKKTKISTQIASNSKFENVSDDVTGSLNAIRVNTQMSRTSAYIKNVQNASDFVKSSLTSLDRATTEMQNIVTLVSNSENALNEPNYSTMVQSIKDSLSAIVQSVNEKHNGMSLFGGTNFSDDFASIDVNGKAVVSATDHSGEIKVQISANTKETMNIPGSKITATGIFDAINNIIDSLAGGTAPTQAQQDALTLANNKLINVQTLAGEKLNRLDNVNEILATRNTNNETLLANIQGVDTAKLSTELNEQDYLLQITYKLLANAFPQSLFDYL